METIEAAVVVPLVLVVLVTPMVALAPICKRLWTQSQTLGQEIADVLPKDQSYAIGSCSQPLAVDSLAVSGQRVCELVSLTHDLGSLAKSSH